MLKKFFILQLSFIILPQQLTTDLTKSLINLASFQYHFENFSYLIIFADFPYIKVFLNIILLIFQFAIKFIFINHAFIFLFLITFHKLNSALLTIQNIF